MQCVFSLRLFFSSSSSSVVGLSDGKDVTHRTSVWLPERVGLGALCQRPDKDPEPGASESRTLSQQTWSHAFRRHPPTKSITSLLSSTPSIDNEGKQHLNNTNLQSEGLTCEKALRDVYRAQNAAQTALTTGCKSVWHKMQKDFLDCLLCVL